MKKIWILEGYITPEKMQESLKDNKELLEDAKRKGDASEIEIAEKMVKATEKRIEDNPDGYWLGYNGKSDYRYFCTVARDTLRWGKKNGMKFRVLKADIKNETVTYWPGNYENGVENAGVLKFLYATL